LDAGFDNQSGNEAVEKHGYVGRTPPGRDGRRGKRRARQGKARRGSVERAWSGLTMCRGFLVRYDKHVEKFLSLIRRGFSQPREALIADE
jgi:hypothetical protein